MNLRRYVITAVLAALFATPLLAMPVAAQTDASSTAEKTPLQQAMEMYDTSRFQEAADLLAGAIRSGRVGGDDLNRARELRARCLAKAGRRIESKEAFKSVLRSDPNYRPNPIQVPPDEMEIFNAALKEFQAEQVEAGRRVPASLGLLYGLGQAINQDIVDLASSAGVPEASDFESSEEFGYSVRFPLSPRYSIDFKVLRMRATTQDMLDPAINDHATYTTTGSPFVATLVWNWLSERKWRVNVLGGVGFMRGEATVEFLHDHFGRLIPVQIVGTKTGPYLEGGLEGEVLLSPRLAVTGSAAGRYANSGELDWARPDFLIYEGFPDSKLGGRNVDFSGFAAHVGVRAYIGY